MVRFGYMSDLERKSGQELLIDDARLDQSLQEVIQRIIDIAQPEKIILFGSSARGNPKSDSDIDLLVIKQDVHRRKLAKRIYRNLFGVGRAVDIIVATPEDLERYGDCPALVIEPALREGKVIYAARTSPTG